MIYYARENQRLLDHLSETADLAKIFTRVFGCENLAYWSGLLHDLGKYTHMFQDYLKRSLAGEDVRRGEVIHALQGAKCAKEKINNHLISDIIGNIRHIHIKTKVVNGFIIMELIFFFISFD
ncbi:MAG: CRISPR-associated endonuclease Cas3'' [Proteobacteria bacterium]|nr:CRISPR-associated endonuclease Cas3'' [Pseudomonadota bacterium]